MNTQLDYTAIWHQYKDSVSRYIFSHISNTTDCEDLVSTVFTKIVSTGNSYRGDPNSVSSFIYRTTQNLVIDYYRTRKRHEEIPESLEAASCIEDEFLKQTTLDFLADALALLGDMERRVIIFHYYKNLSLTDIATKMQISYGRVKLAHNRALSFIKEQFKNYDL
ncbi:MAG: sigma-70 family RNA polymerase sigma factor [Treponema sp.]|nr:sigma-70 family RNA polymerase sigma factor [Treponema sp.]